jgi:hypothetical protein
VRFDANDTVVVSFAITSKERAHAADVRQSRSAPPSQDSQGLERHAASTEEVLARTTCSNPEPEARQGIDQVHVGRRVDLVELRRCPVSDRELRYSPLWSTSEEAGCIARSRCSQDDRSPRKARHFGSPYSPFCGSETRREEAPQEEEEEKSHGAYPSSLSSQALRSCRGIACPQGPSQSISPSPAGQGSQEPVGEAQDRQARAPSRHGELEDLARPGNGQASPPQGSEEGRSHASSEASGRSVGPEASPSPQGVGCSEAPPPS